jgi:lipopolysaccharide biosynthesis glycosyltransferase
MNVIVSFNTKNNPHNISQNVEESIKQSCKNWNCKYIRIETSLQPDGFHDMFTKFYLPHRVINFDRCLYLDTDVVIKHDAPNPFETFVDINNVYVVKDMQQSFLSDEVKNDFKKVQLCSPWYDQCKNALKIDLDHNEYCNGFFNAGVFMFTPKNHIYIFDKIINSLSLISNEYKQIHQVEQALLNYAMMGYLKNKLVYIPKEWNYIDPPLDSSVMEGYIYHFTGWKYQEYKEKIKTFDLWQK